MSDRPSLADLLALGDGRLREGRHDLALLAFNQATELDPSSADAFFKRSATHRLRGDFDKAAADFDGAIRLLWQQRKRIPMPPPVPGLASISSKADGN